MRLILATTVSMLALIHCAPSQSRADHAFIVMELMGSLIEDKSGRYSLLVDGQPWALEMERWQAGMAKEYCKTPNGKVHVLGRVQVTLFGQNLTLRHQSVKVSGIAEAIPTVVVKDVPEGTTGRKYGLRVGDRLVRIQDPMSQEEKQTDLRNEEDLRKVLTRYKGNKVTLCIIREGKYETIENVQLPSREDRILGVPVEVVWMSPIEALPPAAHPPAPAPNKG